MVKKLHQATPKHAPAPSGLLDSQLAQTIKDSAHQIWLAGLGAFAKAQSDRTKMFETLIREGSSLHRKTQAAAGERLGDVAGKMTAMAEEVGNKANAHWDKLESIFEQRTSLALGRLGVPTAKEVAALAARVDALAAAVARLGGGGAAPQPQRSPAARKTRSAPPAPAAKAATPAPKRTRRSAPKA